MPQCKDAMELAARGWRVHPLYGINPAGRCQCGREDCTSPGKHPRIAAWQDAATTDEDIIAEWWERWPDSNVAVVLGPSSGIIDLECDDANAEKFLAELFRGYDVTTPTFSSSRGTHRLFRYTADLPNPDKAHWRLREDVALDVKVGGGGRGTYCVFPPSRHASGVSYRWLIRDVEVAEIPQEVIARIWAIHSEGSHHLVNGNGSGARTDEHWRRVLSGVSEGQRNESAASLIGRMIASMADPTDERQLKINYELIQIWNRSNSPPLPEDELKKTFRSIVDRHIARQDAKKFSAPASLSEDQEQLFDGWSLVRVEGDPPYYKLYSPLWDGCVELSDDDLLSAHRIRREAQRQKCVGLEPSFRRFWDGHKSQPSAYSYLMRTIAKEKARFEERRENVIAARLYERLTRSVLEVDVPDHTGKPVKINGCVWFRFGYLLSEDKVLLDHERVVVRVLKRVCLQPDKARRNSAGQQLRYKVIAPEGMEMLREMAFFDSEEGLSDGEATMDGRDVPAAERG